MMVKLSGDAQRLLVIFISLNLILGMLTYVTITPRPKEKFFQLYVLGENRMAEKYYPNDNPTITLNQPVKWFLGVTNLMGSTQYIIVKVKLGNSTLNPPNESNYTESPLPTITEFRHILLDNETWEFDFKWFIERTEAKSGMLYISSININNANAPISGVGAENGSNFRLIFELWSYDVPSKQFILGWYDGEERRVNWLQLWFNVTR